MWHTWLLCPLSRPRWELLYSLPLDNKSLNFAHLLLVDAKNILNILLEYQRPRSSLLFSSKTTSNTTWKFFEDFYHPLPPLYLALFLRILIISKLTKSRNSTYVLLTTKTSSSCICLKTKSVLVVERGKKKQLA